VTRVRARKSFYVVLAALPFLLAVALIEAGGQVFLLFRPSYDVLFLQPDRALGWTQVPNLEWTWAGVHWHANDFSVAVKTNSRGFRDLERNPRKPEGVVRIALLGDSFVEALQVPLEQTAGQVLETRLNASRTDPARRYEVLNFGISNYGVGQYLLAWENAAREFAPDYVFALVAQFQMQRSVTKYDQGQFDQTAGRRMWVRPTFRLDGDTLVREPAADFDEFVRLRRELIESEFGGRRTRRRVGSFIVHQLKQLGLWRSGESARSVGGWGAEPIDVESMIAVNLRILEELGRDVRASGARFVIVDLSGYAASVKTLSATLARLCSEHGFGYVQLGKHLRLANRRGVRTRWPHDGHFNEAANEIFATAMHEWLAAQVEE
jgi:hypothetical protein